MNQCNNCGRQCTRLSAMAAILTANTKKPMAAFITSKAPQGEGEVAAAQITLVFVGSSDLMANLLSIQKPEITDDARDFVPNGTFMAGIDDPVNLLQIFGGDPLATFNVNFATRLLQAGVHFELTTGLGNANDLTDFNPALLAQLRAEGVLMDPVDGDSGVGKAKVEMISANGVAQIDDVAAKNLGNDAWTRAREAMFGGGAYSLTDMVLTAGRGVIDDETGMPVMGPMAATHGHLAAREHQAALV